MKIRRISLTSFSLTFFYKIQAHKVKAVYDVLKCANFPYMERDREHFPKMIPSVWKLRLVFRNEGRMTEEEKVSVSIYSHFQFPSDHTKETRGCRRKEEDFAKVQCPSERKASLGFASEESMIEDENRKE